MKGKKIFPGKNSSNIFFVPETPKPATKHVRPTTSHSMENSFIGSPSVPIRKKTDFKRRTFSVDNSESKFKEKIVNKIQKTEPNIAKFRKKRDNVSFLFTEKYYQKFVNKNNSVNSSITANKAKNNSQITYELSKTKKDNRVIDTHSVKQSFTRNGINMYKIYNASSGLTSVNNDKVCFTIAENDAKSTIFKQIKKSLEAKGLEITQKNKKNYDKTVSKGIFPAKNNWKDNDVNRGIQRRKSFDQKSTTTHYKKASISKTGQRDLVYKNDLVKELKRHKSVETNTNRSSVSRTTTNQ